MCLVPSTCFKAHGYQLDASCLTTFPWKLFTVLYASGFSCIYRDLVARFVRCFAAFGSRLSRTYEIVHSVTLKMARPLIIFGPLKERITEELLRSDEFATCIQRKFPRFGFLSPGSIFSAFALISISGTLFATLFCKNLHLPLVVNNTPSCVPVAILFLCLMWILQHAINEIINVRQAVSCFYFFSPEHSVCKVITT